MKRNSSKNLRKTAGFTLVELVVVIAVLAILAGVGVVAYNGYITYAQKGKDRQLVGEVMHALELADYADPTLFGEDGGAMIVISTKGTDAAGLSEANTAALKTALEDAFGEGELASTKLSYDKWPGTANMNVFNGLGDPGTQVEAYLNNIKNNGGVPTAFAEDMEEYWDVFEGLINGMNDGTILGTDQGINVQNMDEIRGKIVDKVVSTYNSAGGNDYNDVISTWADGSKSFRGGTNSFGFGGRDLNLARNYAFISYAKRRNLTPEMKAELEKFEKEHKFDTMEIITNSRNLTEPGWKDIIDAYYTTQAESDARAYLGLMEAAGQVQKNLKEEKGEGNYTDDDFLNALTPYVGMVSNILTGKTDLSIIQNLAKGATGSVVIINVTKKDGVLRLEVSPDDANPRTGSSVAEEVKYTENESHIDWNETGGSTTLTSKQTVVLKPGDSVTVVGTNLASGYTLDTEASTPGLTGSISGNSITINASSDAKSGVIVFSKTSLFGEGKSTITIYVDVK